MKHPLAAPALLLLALLLVALAAPWLVPFSPSEQLLERRLEGPSASHWLGLDELGRDVLSRLIYGTRVSVTVGLSVVALAALVGTLIGSIAGYWGGAWDTWLMRLCEVFLAFPGTLLAIAMVAVLGPALLNLIIALAAVGWVGYARLVRAQVLSLRKRPFIEAAVSAGLPTWRILLRHVLPQVAPTLVVQSTLGVAGAILAEAGLSFLGLGVATGSPSWGAMINAGRSHLLDAPHVAFFPGLAIFVVVAGLNLLGDALADRLSIKAD
ncbi:MAG TPA: ABC transporter permease [Thermoanaerobaculia bacterium]|nr:ABC transporter permease [Thermoanaerobaculia bacterium]